MSTEAKDMRGPSTKARDEWMESEDGIKACDAGTLGQYQPGRDIYLKNRLESAFAAGYKAAVKSIQVILK